MKKIISIILLTIFSFAFAQERSVFDIARNGTVEEMKTLMKKNNKIIDSTDSMTFSPLILACYRGNTDVANFLMDYVADINYESAEGTALAALAINYNKDLVLKILEKKANPNLKDGHGNTPLLWAIKTGKKELAEILLKHGADKNIKDNEGISAFEHSIITRKQDMINLLKTY